MPALEHPLLTCAMPLLSLPPLQQPQHLELLAAHVTVGLLPRLRLKPGLQHTNLKRLLLQLFQLLQEEHLLLVPRPKHFPQVELLHLPLHLQLQSIYPEQGLLLLLQDVA